MGIPGSISVDTDIDKLSVRSEGKIKKKKKDTIKVVKINVDLKDPNVSFILLKIYQYNKIK